MSETGCECPVCSEAMLRFDADIRRCAGCGYFLSDFPSGAGTGIDGLEALRRANYEIILDCLGRRRPLSGLRLLEVGCAKGWFLEAARRRGMVVRGLEPELANQQQASAKGFDVVHGYFPQAVDATEHFDVIAFNDVFEHLPDAAAAIKAVEKRLAPGGALLINIPNSGGFLFQVARALRAIGLKQPWDRLWQKGLASPHISYFNADNLVRLVERHTVLKAVDQMALASMTRVGLGERVTSANPGWAGAAMFAAVWPLTFVAGWLPSDIVLVIFERPSER